MPDTIIVNTSLRVGETAAAVIKTHLGRRQAKTPVRVTLVNDGLLRVGTNDFRGIIARTGMNGVTNYLVKGSRLSLAEQQRRYALAHARDLLRQLTAVLKPLATEEFVAQQLQIIFDWISEREEEQTSPPPNTECSINVHKW